MNVFSLLARGAVRPPRWRRKNYRGIVGVLASGAVVAAGLALTPAPASAVAVPNWSHLTPSTNPPAARDAAMAYDAAHSKMVLFGGELSGGVEGNETWTYDGTTWTNATPAPVTDTNNPGPRAAATMVYDAAIGKIVLFGGRVTNVAGYANDTWTYDGTTWVQVIGNGAAGSPPRRQQGMMTYDASLGKVVLFGGYAAGTGRLDDTWTFDGTTWTDVSGTSRPSPRTSGAMGFDPTTASVILFGGFATGGAELNDTWSWKAGTWTQLSPVTPPSARGYCQLAYDPDIGSLVLYGGFGASTFADTWSFDATANAGTGAWTHLAPAANPGARFSYSMAYDVATSQMILFGGYSMTSGFLNDTWAYAVPAVNPPDAPAAPSVVTGNAQVTVSWTPPSDGGSAITEYTVAYRVTGSSSAWSSETVMAPTTTATISSLLNGTSYDFKVRARNGIDFGAYSAVTAATPSTVPSAPAMPTLTAGNTQVLVSWTPPATGGSPITGYTVAYRTSDGRKWLTTTTSDTSKMITGLTNNVQYVFKVLATNKNGNGPYSPERAAMPYAANAPGTPLDATAVGQPSADGRSLDVVLTWTDSGNAATDHEVTIYTYRMNNKGVASYRVTGTVLTGSGASTFTVTGLGLHKQYAFSVAAGNADGWSVPSTPSNSVGG